MPKRYQQPDAAAHLFGSATGWNIGSDGLPSSGQSDLLQHLGDLMRKDYQRLLKEPVPDRFRLLLERLEDRRSSGTEEEDQGGSLSHGPLGRESGEPH